jgi:hypothetical protein
MKRKLCLFLVAAFMVAQSMAVLGCGGDGDENGRSEGTEVGDCTNRADDDGDGLFDCLDEGCSGSPDCVNVVENVPFDTQGCIGSSAASESLYCYDWAKTYSLALDMLTSSNLCANPVSCQVAQKGCRLAVRCDIPSFPIVCTDLDPWSNSASASFFYAEETYTCTTSYSGYGTNREVLQLHCNSPSFTCNYNPS